MQHFKKEEGAPSLLCQGALLTWGNICCVEIETDDSNYVQAEGSASKDAERRGGDSGQSRAQGPQPRPAGAVERWRSVLA